MNKTIDQIVGVHASEPAILVLMGLLVVATITDYDHRKIPNWLTGLGVIAGLYLTTAAGTQSAQPMMAFLGAILGGSVGLLLLLPLYAIGKMGGGDVKLMAMSGTFLGTVGVFWAVMWSLIAGGILALLWIVLRLGLKSTAFRLVGTWSTMSLPGSTLIPERTEDSILKTHMPYAAAIASGVLISHWFV